MFEYVNRIRISNSNVSIQHWFSDMGIRLFERYFDGVVDASPASELEVMGSNLCRARFNRVFLSGMLLL